MSIKDREKKTERRAPTSRIREERKEERKKRKKKEEKIKNVWILYGFLWVFMD